MKVRNRVLSIAVSVLMIFSMLVCGIDQTVFAAQEETGTVAEEQSGENASGGEAGEAVNEVPAGEDAEGGAVEEPGNNEPAVQDVTVEETGDATEDGLIDGTDAAEPEDAAGNAGEPEKTAKGSKKQAAEKSSGTKRTIMLYDVGADLETEAGLA